MWVKKHAPRTFADVVGNADIVKRFVTMSETRYLQHMILCGAAGVGKSSLVEMITREMLGDHVRTGTLVFESADDTGNQAVRDKIHQFVPKKLHTNSTPKFVVFKQADRLSDGVQQIMRRLMEQHYHHAVFIFVCRDLTSLLETLQSRCHVFRFRPVSVDAQVQLLRIIAQKEHVVTHADSSVPYERIAQMAQGDVRACVNYFQATCCSLVPDAHGVRTLDDTTVRSVCLFPHYDKVDELFRTLQDTSDLAGFHACLGIVRELHQQGYCGLDIAMFLHTYLLTAHARLSPPLCLAMMKDIALAHHRLSQGVDSVGQLYALVAAMFGHANE